MKNKQVEEKDELLEQTLNEIQKLFGKGAVMRLGDRESVSVESIHSGSILLDECLGVGGYPKGRVIEIFGPESSGKTTLALHAIAECQKVGGRAAFIDAEHSVDPEYAQRLGVNTDELLLAQPDSGEQALGIVDMLASSGAISLIVVDSVAALVPEAEIEGEIGDSSVGLQARLMSKALRGLVATLNKKSCTVIFINQLREKVGVMYGNPEVTTGGKALKFYATIRIDIRRTEALKNGGEIYGNTVRIKVVKNKVAPPFRSCDLDIIYGKGICKEGEIIDLASELEIVKKSGVWYEYNGVKIAQGREAAKTYLLSHPEVKDELVSKIEELRKVQNQD